MNEYDDILKEESAAAPSPAPAPARNEYSEIFAEESEQQHSALRQSMYFGAQSSPDKFAKVLNLAKHTSLPVDTVERNFDEVQKQHAVDSFNYSSMIEKTPGTARWAQDPNNAALAHDDLPATTKLEDNTKDYSALTSMASGLAGNILKLWSNTSKLPALAVDVANLGNMAIGGAATGFQFQSPEWLRNNPVTSFLENKVKDYEVPELSQSFWTEMQNGNREKAVRIFAVQFAANAPTQAAIIAGTLAGLGIPTLIGAGAISSSEANFENQNNGVNPAIGTVDALGKGTIEAAFESIGTFGVLKTWENAIAKQYGKQVSGAIITDFAKTLAYSVAAEGNEEALTSVAQDLTDYVTGVNPHALTGIFTRAADAGTLGAASGGGMTAPAAIGAGIVRNQQAAQARHAKEFYLSLGKDAEAMKLRERAPEAQRALVEEITKDGEITHVIIPAEAVKKFFQDRKEDPSSFMQGIGVLDDYNEASENGGDVRVPIGTWIQKVVGTEYYAGLANDVRLREKDKSVNELKAENESLAAQAEAAASETQAPAETEKQALDQIETTLGDQLQAAGRDRKEAGVIVAGLGTLAKRSGLPIADLFNQYQLAVQGADQKAGTPSLPNDVELADSTAQFHQDANNLVDASSLFGKRREQVEKTAELKDIIAQSGPLTNGELELLDQRVKELNKEDRTPEEELELNQIEARIHGSVTAIEGPERLETFGARFGEKADGKKARKAIKNAQDPKQGPYVSDENIPGIGWAPNYAAEPTGVIGPARISESHDLQKFSETDPLKWAELKYGATKALILKHKQANIPLVINTSSDLVSHDDYIEAMPSDTTVNMYLIPEELNRDFGDLITRVIFPGNPSRKRQMEAVKRLEEAGIKVNAIEPTVESVISAAGGKRRVAKLMGIKMAEVDLVIQRAIGRKLGVVNDSGEVTFFQDAIPSDEEVKKLRARVAELETELRTSPKTGLRNQKAFDEDSALNWPSVTAIDMDGLKRLNDSLGHKPADQVLQALGAVLLAAQADSPDVRFYHLSGDEFAGRFKNPEAVRAFMEDLQNRLESVDVEVYDANGVQTHRVEGIGISFGEGATYEEADGRANEQKAERLASGKREEARKPGPSRRVHAIAPVPAGNDDQAGQSQDQVKKFDQSPNSLGFYSKLQRTIEEKLGPSATVEQVEALLRDTKAEERKWSGVDEFLKGKEKVSKAELLEFLAANQLEVKEVTKSEGAGGEESLNLSERKIFREVSDLSIGNAPEDISPEDVVDAGGSEELSNQWAEMIQSGAIARFNGGGVKFEQYTLPGGENYREVLFTLPEKGRAIAPGFRVENRPEAGYRGMDFALIRESDGGVMARGSTAEEAIKRHSSSKLDYHSGHWDESNVLAHVRLNDRTDADGKKVLFVEEIQSDWGQAGRKKGFAGERQVPEGAKVEDRGQNEANPKNRFVLRNTEGEIIGIGPTEETAIQDYKDVFDRHEGVVPPMPFKKTWHEFALKRIIRMAAEGGYDRVAWTTGEQQAERYDLSKQVDSVSHIKNTDGTYNIVVSVKSGGPEEFRSKTAEQLEGVIGKELTKKIVDGEGKKSKASKMKVLDGLDLKVGGEGMKGFYDKILVDFANKFAKKFGAKVGEAKLDTQAVGKVAGLDVRSASDGSWQIIDGSGAVYRDDAGGYYENYESKEEAQEVLGQIEVGSTGTKVHSLEITDALKEAALNEGFSLFQGGDEGPRGQIQLNAGKAIITLGKSADFSTFAHESGHYFLEVLGALATQENAPQQIKDDFGKLLNWFGVESRDQIETKHHEMFARGFEKYLAEGKAPSEGLRSMFAQFKVWMIAVYKQLKNLNIELSDDVRGVMDRLLATDEEIAQAREVMAQAPLFTDAATFGMTGAKAQRYLEATQAAKQAAEEELTGRVIREHNRHLATWWEEERAGIAGQIEKETNAQPVYIADSVLRRGVLPDGSALPPGMEPIKLSKKALTPEQIKALPRGVTHKDGIHPDIAAEMFGFASGKALIEALTKAEPREALIKRLADNEMLDRHGEMLRDNSIKQEAINAVHNDKQAELLQLELEHLASNDLPVLKDMIRRVARRPPTVKQVRAQAERTIGNRKLSDLKPYLFQRAEAKSAKQAGELLAKGDFQGAFDAKLRELLNHELYRAAVNAEAQVDKSVDKFKKIAKSDESLAKSRDVDLVNAARAVLANVGLGKTDETAAQYLEPIRKYDPDTYETIKALVDAAPATGSYKQLTYDQFLALHDAVMALWDFAKTSREIEIDGEKRNLQEVQAEMELAITLRTSSGEKVGYDHAASKMDKVKLGLLGIRAALRRVEHWVTSVDKGDPNGALRRYLFNPIAQGTANYRSAKAVVLQKYLNLLKPIESSLAHDPIEAPELGYRFSGRAEIIGALLHRGNQSNFSKLLRGRKWGEVDANGNLDTSRWDAFINRMIKEGNLTKQDFEFAQGVWDLMEELKPDLQRAHKQMYGFYFNEVTADEFQTPWGAFKGGYVPAKVDPFASSDPALRQDESAMEVSGGFAFPTTGRGATKSRVNAYAAPLQMDLRFIPQHIDWALRFAHIEPRVKAAARIVLNRGFRKVLDKLDPTVGTTLLVPWLQRAASQKIETASKGWGGRAADTFFKEVRRRTGLNIMVANVSNALQQFTGLSIAAVKVHPKHLRNALWEYTRNPKAMTEQVNEASTFMATRVTGQVFELQQHLDDLLLNPTKFEKARKFAQKHGYILQAGTQNIVDVVTWTGAYNEAIESGEDDLGAVRIADSAVRLTQGSFNAEDVSSFETGSPFMRAFTMFYSYFNMQANLLGTEFANIARDMGLKKGAGRALYVYTMGFMIPAVMSELIIKAMSGKLDDDDDGQYLDDLMGVFFGAQFRTASAFFPIVGPVVQAGINQFNNKWYDDRITTSPAVSAIESAVSAPHSVYQAITADGSKKRAARDTLTLLGLMTGLPLAPLARPLGYLSDVQEGKAVPTGPLDIARGLISGKPGNTQ